MSDLGGGDVRDLRQAMLQQQAAMLQVQAESLRLQRLLVERLLGDSSVEVASEVPQPTERPLPTPTRIQPPSPIPADTSAPTVLTESNVVMKAPAAAESARETMNPTTPEPGSLASSQTAVNPSRSARYYQPRPSPGVPSVKPEELELMRRLQEMREASGLILQFGPFKGTTLAQVALRNPEYIRQLVLSAQRPEVRAAAGRLVQALEAAADHKHRSSRPNRRGRSNT